MSERYKVGDDHIPHFITSTVVGWIDLLTRPVYKDIIIESLRYCQEHKDLRVHAFCIMSSHVHLIVSSVDEKLENIIRDMKKFTSKRLIQAIKENPESRREWMLESFEFAARRIKRVKNYKFWQDGFHPVELNINEMQEARLEYVHDNPVVEGLLYRQEDYVYSSASFYYGKKCLIEINKMD